MWLVHSEAVDSEKTWSLSETMNVTTTTNSWVWTQKGQPNKFKKKIQDFFLLYRKYRSLNLQFDQLIITVRDPTRPPKHFIFKHLSPLHPQTGSRPHLSVPDISMTTGKPLSALPWLQFGEVKLLRLPWETQRRARDTRKQNGGKIKLMILG